MKGVVFNADFPWLEHLADACARDEDFRRRFGTEEACVEWFKNARWPSGFQCAKCGNGGRWLPERRAMVCSWSQCRKVTSVTADTLLHATKKPLRTWFEAAYLIVQRGVNARTLQRSLRLTYKVAWAWAHKLRRALRACRTEVHLDASRKHGEYCEDPDPDGKGPCGCSRLLKRDWGWPNEVEDNREAARIESLVARGYPRPKEEVPADAPEAATARAHWELLATYKGAISEKHLRAYLDELEFRYERKERPVAENFVKALHGIVRTPPRSYRDVHARPKPEGHPLSIFELRTPSTPWFAARRRRVAELRGSSA